MAGCPVRAGWAGCLAALLAVAGCQSPGELNPDLPAPPASVLKAKPKPRTGEAAPPAALAAKSVPAKTADPAPPEPAPIRLAASWEAAADGKPSSAADAEKLAIPATPVSPGPLSLGLPEAIETGLSRNPDLITLRESENVGRAIVGVARTYPFNPTVQTRILPYNRTQAGTNAATYNYVLVWQQFELCHQRKFREENAAAALDATRWNVQQAELTNVALTTQLYFTALYTKGLQELAERTAEVNDKLLAVTEKRGRAGQASVAEVAMVRFDTRSARQQAQLAGIAYQNAVLALRRQLNLPPETPLTLDGDLTDFAWSPVSGAELAHLTGGDGSVFSTANDQEALAAVLASHRPDVMAARANSQAAQANVRLAHASRVPNLWIGPFYSRDSEAIVSLGFQAQMDVPVVNTGKPLERQRQAEMRQQMVNLEQLQNKAKVEARTALERYERARLLHEQTRGDAGLQVPEELQKLETQFARGEIDIVRITQSRNSLLAFRRTYLDSLNELALSAAALIGAAGLPPAALVCRLPAQHTVYLPPPPEGADNSPPISELPPLNAAEDLPQPTLSIRPAE